MPDVSMTCPICGGPLTETDPKHSADTTPFLCERDARGWWGSELTAEARKAFDTMTRSIPDREVRTAVMAGVRDEVQRRAARVRPPNPKTGGR